MYGSQIRERPGRIANAEEILGCSFLIWAFVIDRGFHRLSALELP